MKDIYVLGIESSCDETSIAIIKDGELLSNVVATQIEMHQKYGGVMPELASRLHCENALFVLDEALTKANITLDQVDAFAFTRGPGLIGALHIGMQVAKTLAMLYNKPLIPVHHLAGHIYANSIEHDMKFPSMALLVSGGNTELIYMKEHFSFEIIGETLDDAVGEAYDKVARVVGIGYPGGPKVDKLAHLGKDTYHLPRVTLGNDNYNFSFSGLKSAVINLHHNAEQRGEEINVNDLCASFQEAVTDVLVEKALKACKEYNVNQLIVAGGVSANKGLKEKFFATNKNKNLEICIPSIKYCTDNAVMLACAGYFRWQKNNTPDDLTLNADASLELDSVEKN
jgi:N6-L-threonylcarbamoyladenine synthase